MVFSKPVSWERLLGGDELKARSNLGGRSRTSCPPDDSVTELVCAFTQYLYLTTIFRFSGDSSTSPLIRKDRVELNLLSRTPPIMNSGILNNLKLMRFCRILQTLTRSFININFIFRYYEFDYVKEFLASLDLLSSTTETQASCAQGIRFKS